MNPTLRRACHLGFLLLVVTLARAAGAQETPRAADAQLRAFAVTVVQIERIRYEVADELALPENKTVERQAELRDGMKSRIAQAIRSHGLTQALYDRFEYLVTTDEEWRVVFERRLAAARGPAQGPR